MAIIGGIPHFQTYPHFQAMVWFWLAAVAPWNLTRLNPYSPGRESADGWWSEIIRRKVLQDELSNMVSTSGFAKRWTIALMWYKPSPDGRFVLGFTVNTTSSLLCPLPLLLGCTPHCLEISTLDCSFWLIALGEWFAPLPCVYPSGGEVRHLLVWPMLSQTCCWKEQQRNITPSMSCGSKFKTQETIEFVLSSINRLSFRVANCLIHHFLQIK